MRVLQRPRLHDGNPRERGNFHWVDGMTGGARGECQLADGLSVDAQFPPD
jgi:hypothetical protein